MEILFAILVGALLIAVVAWAARPSFAFDSSLTVIVLAWAYYTLAVPLDLWLGFNVRGSQRLPDSDDPALFGYVVDVVLYYVSFMAGVLISYKTVGILQGNSARPGGESRAGLMGLPGPNSVLPGWCAYLVAGLAVVVYWTIVETANRGLQEQSLREDAYLRSLSFLVEISLGWVVWHILNVDDARRALRVLPAAAIVGLLTGARVYLGVAGLIYLLRYRIGLTLRARVALVVGAGLAVVLWKVMYSQVSSVLLTGELLELSDMVPNLGLAELEASDAWGYFIYFLREGSSPLWLGWSYVKLTLANLAPRALSGVESSTLAVEYAMRMNPMFAEAPMGLGFSGLAEAWLNFGPLGPFAIGVVWGGAASLLDSRPRSLAFYVFAIMSARFFRSDFASLAKTWCVVFASAVLMVGIISRILVRVSGEMRRGLAELPARRWHPTRR
ncbi:MAG TPA: hypothetical protein VFE97_21710 [Methylomirabilota bacterium]|nr:hypothetical protein [Methylomirabilota bacterium]